MATLTKKTNKINDDYLSLVMRFPLKHIKDVDHLEEAHKLIDELSIIPENELTDGQRDYLLALGDLTSAFEDALIRDDMAKITGLDVLKHLLEENDMNASDLGRLLGNRELGSKILRGDREISKSHSKILGERFCLASEVFLR